MKKNILVIGGLVTLLLTGCMDEDSSQKGQRIQEAVAQKAMNVVPVPELKKFPTREVVKKYLEHTNKPDQTHYIYVMLPGVGYVGYYVATSEPVNICTSMTTTAREYDLYQNNQLGPAPSLDGVYYGSQACNKDYFFDSTTGAKIVMNDTMGYFVSSQPLAIDAPRLKVDISQNEN